MNYCQIKKWDIANGPGVRVSLFVSGCDHHCKGCFQPETWDYTYGKKYTDKTEKYVLNLLSSENIQGLSLLGGDPFCGDNPNNLVNLVKETKNLGKDIWCYTGYKFEELLKFNNPSINKLISMIDVIVDGKYVEELKNISLQFRGSSNQRIILCNKSNENNIQFWHDSVSYNLKEELQN